MKNVVVRFTALRLLIFFGFLMVFWLAGLRGTDQQLLLLVLSAGASLVVSYFFLRRDRDAMSEHIAERVERRVAQRRAGSASVRGEDEEAEDAELDDPRP